MFNSRWAMVVTGVSIASLCWTAQGFAADDDGDSAGAPGVTRMADGRDGREGRPGPGGPGMGEEHLDALIAVLKDADPDFAAKVEQARRNNQREVRELLAPQAQRLFMMAQLKKSDPEIYALKIEDFKLVRKAEALAQDIKKTEKDGKFDEAKVKELKELLNKQFDLRQQIQEKDLERLEKKVQELKERIDRRKANKEQMLTERLKEMTDKTSGKDW